MQGYGLKSRFYHLHLAMDWNVSDNFRLSSLTGYNNERVSELSDLDNYYDVSTKNSSTATGARSYFDFPYIVEHTTVDWSQEVRASYDAGPFKATVGGSYLQSLSKNGLGGGNGALGTSTFSAVNGSNRSKTEGAFFGLSYQLTSKLSLNFDGRYKIDQLYTYAPPAGVNIVSDVFAPIGQYAGGALLAHKNYKNFLPRAIVQYNATPNLMAYASYSQGVNPAGFNNQFLAQGEFVQRTAAANGYALVVNPEKLDNYEVGIKGRLFDNRIRYSAAVYRAIWKNQINSTNLSATDPATNINYTITAALNAGRVRMTGIEGQVTAFVTPELTLDLGGAINDSHIEKLVAPTITALTGITDFSGKQNPYTSKYSATASAEYRRAIPGFDDMSGYIRGDFVYKSGVYSDAANTVRTQAYKNVNLRLGATRGSVNVELFTTNLFNNRAYTNIQNSSVLVSNFAYSAVSSELLVGLRDLRTFGIRVHYAL